MQINTLINRTIVFCSVLALGIALLSFHREYFQLRPNTNTTTPFPSPNLLPNPTLSPQSSPLSPPVPILSKPPPEVSHVSKLTSVRHNMDDVELLRRASVVLGASRTQKLTPKIAFMFLVRRDVTLGPLWEMFFKGHEELYSVYVHSDPFSGSTTVPETSVLYSRRIPSKAVKWGEISMVEAERRLLGNALLDPGNQRFVLLSETCIPLFNFSTVYAYLTGTTKSFVESYDIPGGRHRYKAQMQPLVTLAQWRKGSQWFALDRRVARAVAADNEYFPLFQRLCRGCCMAEEHYLSTFVSIELWRENANRTLTWVDWTKRLAHPASFGRLDVTAKFLQRLRHGGECEYEGQRTNVCHLFAKKFLPNTLDRLLRFAPKIMQFT